MDSTGALIHIYGVVSPLQEIFGRFTWFKIRPPSRKGKGDELAVTVDINPSQPTQDVTHLVGPALR